MKVIHILVKNREQYFEVKDIANFKEATPNPKFFDEVEEKGGLWLRLVNRGGGKTTRSMIAWANDRKPDAELGYHLWEDIC